MNNRIKSAVREVESAFPDRAMHEAYFRQLLGDAFASEIAAGAPVAFVYIGQTRPTPTQGFTMQLAIADPTELLAAFVNAVRLSRDAGKITDAALGVTIDKLREMLPQKE